MENLKELKINNKNGITLISLVVTIVVLVILAGISITMLVGDNGILTRASKAKEQTEVSEEKEGVRIAVLSSQMKDDTYSMTVTKDNLEKAIKEQFGNSRKFTISENDEGSFTIKCDDTDRMYYVESSGKVIENENILKISTADELKVFRDEVNNGNTFEEKYICLTSNITLDINEIWTPIGYYPSENSSPDAETNKPFKGIFDGNGYEIEGIYINCSDSRQGLFGLVIDGTIKNVGIGRNCSITGDVGVGALVAVIYNNSKVINCYNKSDLTVGAYSGGIVAVARNNSSVINCYNTGNINAKGRSIRWNIRTTRWQFNDTKVL